MSNAMASPVASGPRRLRFADLGMRAKILSLVGVAIVAALTVGAIGQQALSSSQASAHDLMDEHWRPALLASKASGEWARYRTLILTVVVTTDPQQIKTAQADIATTEKNLEGLLDAYAVAVAVAEDRQRVQALSAGYQDAVKTWHGSLEAAAAAARTPDEMAAAMKRIDSEFVPKAQTVSSGFDALVALNQKQSDTAVAASDASAGRATVGLWVGVGVAAVGLALLGLWVAAALTRPIRSVQAALDALAEGDLTRAVDADSRDEVGRMAASLTRAQAVLRESMTTIVTSSATLAGSAEELSAVSAQVAASAEETSVQSGTAAAAAEQVSRNVQTVASATEQMSASIMEISQSSTEAVRVAQAAAAEAQTATGTVAKLGDSSREIGDVVKVITSIAEQTNLLALNATIEAARAGEAGKGFAVVASEVKDLAQETARATEDISKRIEAIQTDSEAAVAAIARIAEIIEEVNSYQSTIAAAVEEQTATTSEMSRSVQEAATGAGGIAGNIEYVATAAQASSTGIVEAQRAAAELAQLSGDLRELVARYTV